MSLCLAGPEGSLNETYRDVIPPPNPPAKRLGPFRPTKPQPPLALDNPALIQRANEQDRGQQETAQDIAQVDGPPAEQAQRSAERGTALVNDKP